MWNSGGVASPWKGWQLVRLFSQSSHYFYIYRLYNPGLISKTIAIFHNQYLINNHSCPQRPHVSQILARKPENISHPNFLLLALLIHSHYNSCYQSQWEQNNCQHNQPPFMCEVVVLSKFLICAVQAECAYKQTGDHDPSDEEEGQLDVGERHDCQNPEQYVHTPEERSRTQVLYCRVTFAAEKRVHALAEVLTIILHKIRSQRLLICWLSNLKAFVVGSNIFLSTSIAEMVSTGALHMVTTICLLYNSFAPGALAVTQCFPKILQLGILTGALMIAQHALVAVDCHTFVASWVRDRVLFFLCLFEMFHVDETLACLFGAHSYVRLFENLLVSFEFPIFLHNFMWQIFETLRFLVDRLRAACIWAGNSLEPPYFVDSILVEAVRTKYMFAFPNPLCLSLGLVGATDPALKSINFATFTNPRAIYGLVFHFETLFCIFPDLLYYSFRHLGDI